jgi:ABC-2 type transport system permease protein
MSEDSGKESEIHTELRGFYAVWYREIIRYLKDRPRVVAAVFTPLVWLILFGIGFSSFFRFSGINYVNFVFPGIIAQTILFTSIYLGTSIMFDKQFGYLKEILVAPIRRISIFSGKLFGGATDAMIQGIIVLALSFIFGIGVSPSVFLACLPIMLIIAIIITSMSLTIATRLKSFESFSLVMTFIVLPLFFSSGALFPLETAPSWFQALGYINPLTYAVDALRGLMLGHTPTVISLNQLTIYYDLIRTLLFGNHIFPLWLDIAVLGAFALVVVAVGVSSFGKRT